MGKSENPLIFEYTSSALNPADSGAYGEHQRLQDALQRICHGRGGRHGAIHHSEIYNVSLDEGLGTFQSLEEVVFDFCVSKNVVIKISHSVFNRDQTRRGTL